MSRFSSGGFLGGLGRERAVVLGGLMLGMLLGSIDQSIVSTALPTIVGDLGGANRLSWIVTAYLITVTVTTPLYGKLSDLYGRSIVYEISVGIFLLGSMLSGLAGDVPGLGQYLSPMTQLALFRALQGVGAGLQGVDALASVRADRDHVRQARDGFVLDQRGVDRVVLADLPLEPEGREQRLPREDVLAGPDHERPRRVLLPGGREVRVDVLVGPHLGGVAGELLEGGVVLDPRHARTDHGRRDHHHDEHDPRVPRHTAGDSPGEAHRLPPRSVRGARLIGSSPRRRGSVGEPCRYGTYAPSK